MGNMAIPAPEEEVQTSGLKGMDNAFSAPPGSIPDEFRTLLETKENYSELTKEELESALVPIIGQEEFDFFWHFYGEDKKKMATAWTKLRELCLPEPGMPAHFYFVVKIDTNDTTVQTFEATPAEKDPQTTLDLAFWFPVTKSLWVTYASPSTSP
jgi:hypothetical protein